MVLRQALCLALLAACPGACLAGQPWASARERFYHQRLDHFAPSLHPHTWAQRYFIAHEHWSSASGPIFFYGQPWRACALQDVPSDP